MTNLVIYPVRCHANIFDKMRLISISINDVEVCTTDKSTISFNSQTCLNKWIPIGGKFVSGILFHDKNHQENCPWDQSIICHSINGVDKLYLYYLFVKEYEFPIPDNIASKKLLLPNVKPGINCAPMIIGHAGAGVERAHFGNGPHWPENTVCAFRRAEQLGVSMVECDAGVTRDCEDVVLHHNFTLKIKENLDAREKGSSFCVDHDVDGTVTEKTKDLIVNNSLLEIRRLLSKLDSPIYPPHCSTTCEPPSGKYPIPLNMNDPIPDVNGTEAAFVPLLKDAFHGTSLDLGFNVECKYPPETPFNLISKNLDENKEIDCFNAPHTYFTSINKFCDAILDVICKHAGPRHVLLSSFNADVCLALRLKQDHFPVFFITRGGLSSDSSHRGDPRHLNLIASINWAHLMNLKGVVTMGEHFGSVPNEQIDNAQIQEKIDYLASNELSCFVYGEGVSELSFFNKAIKLGLNGLIVDRLDEYMHEFQVAHQSN